MAGAVKSFAAPPVSPTAATTPTQTTNNDNPPITTNVVYRPVYKHWFYKKSASSAADSVKFTWTPFSMSDSINLEDGLSALSPIVNTNGGRFDVDVAGRKRMPIYWTAEPDEVRRCSWFYKGIDSRFVPYDEDVADQLELEYRAASEAGEWNKKLPLPNGETIVFHGPSVMVHFLQAQSPDSWTANAVPVWFFFY